MMRATTSVVGLLVMVFCIAGIAAGQTGAPALKRSWAELASPASWPELPIQLLVPASAGAPSRVETVSARAVVLPLPPDSFWLVAVSDPYTGITYIAHDGQVFVSTADSLIGVVVIGGTLNLSAPYMRVPTASGGITAAIERFAHEFTPERVAKEWREYRRVELSRTAPRNFFQTETRIVTPELMGMEMESGVLRVELRSHTGAVGMFWIDIPAAQILKSVVDGKQTYPAQQVARDDSSTLASAATSMLSR